MRYALNNDWETHVNMKHKKKQSWHHTLGKTYSELAGEQHSYEYNSRQEEDMAGTQLELPSEGGFRYQNPDNSYSSSVEQEINSTEINTVNTRATLSHLYIMRQGGATLGEYSNTLESEEVYRENTQASGFRRPYKTSYRPEENSIEHEQAKPNVNSDYPHNTRRGEGSIEGIDKEWEFERVHKEGTGKLDFRGPYNPNYALGKNSSKHRDAKSSGNSDHPHTMRQ